MKSLRQKLLCVTALGLLALATTPVLGQYTVSIDENGHGSLSGTALPFAVGPEPISGITTLYYISPVPLVPGDVLLFETAASGVPSDMLRFGGPNNNYVYFFSDAEPTERLDLADVAQIPPPVTTSSPVTLVETGPEGANGANYAPTAGQPGFYLPGTTVNYTIISDVVPEPSGLALASLGGGLLLLFRRRLYSRAS